MPKKIIYILLSILLTSVTFADTTPPVTTLTKNPENPNGNENWYLNPVEINLNATDLESGVREVNYKINENEWEKRTFYQTLNLAPNASFEIPGLESWSIANNDPLLTATTDYTTYAPTFGKTSAKLVSQGLGWHGINHIDNFAVVSPYKTVTASVWLKTLDVTQNAYFKIYSVSLDQSENLVATYLGQSNTISGTQGWSKLSKSVAITNANSLGVFVEIGLEGTGTLWTDAINISESGTQEQISIFVNNDGENIVQYYSTDQSGNVENIKSINIKIDQTPPSNWGNSTTIHAPGDPEYFLKVQTNVRDSTSGLSNLTKEFQYKVTNEYGNYENILDCTTFWDSGNWINLDSYPTNNGISTTTLTTPKISFCDNTWNKCKAVRFKAFDIAGNVATKEYCINGSWIKTTGGGKIRAEYGINMTTESSENNADGIIESGNNFIEFFSTSNNYRAKNTTTLKTQNYNYFLDKISNKTAISTLNTESGVFNIQNSYTISSLPEDFNNNTFNKVVFVEGDLTIDTDILINNPSTLLFIVKGDIKINKDVQNIQAGLMTDKSIYTAYDINPEETTEKLDLKGVFSADKFILQRTLIINTEPTEQFIYEPKYLVKMKAYISESQIEWLE